MNSKKTDIRERVGFFIASALLILVIVSASSLSYLKIKRRIISDIDRSLYVGAASIKSLLSADFHDKATSSMAITPEYDKQNIIALSKFANRIDFKFLYTLIKKNNKIFITSSSATEQELAQNEEVRYFTPFDEADPIFHSAFEGNTPISFTHKDRWGTFRALAIPEKSPEGKIYVSVAEFDITYLDRVFQSVLIETIAIYLLLLLGALPLYYMASKRLRRIVNERKLAQIAFQKSEEKFRTFVENANDIIYQVNPEGVFTYASPNWTEILGYEIDEVIGKTVNKFVHPDDVQTCIDFLNRVISTGEKQTGIEYRVRHKNSTWRWHYSSGAPIIDANGKVVSYVGIARDITETREQEKARLEMYQRYRTVLKNFPNGAVFLFDRDLKYIHVEGKALKELGLVPDKMIGRTVKEIFPPEVSDVAYKKQLLLFEGKACYYEVEFGGNIYGNWGEPVINDNNQIKEGVIFAVNITERKQSEKALGESEQRLQAVFNSVDGVPIQGYDKDRRVILWNTASELLYGYSRDEAMGSALEELIIPEESQQAVVEGIRQWHEQGIPIPSGEIELLNKSGERLQVYSNHVMITNHRGEKEMLCIDVNLTERKRAEEVMRESEKRFATAFQYSPAPLVLSEVDTGLFIDINDRWIEMLGFTREEQIGKTSKEVGIWDDPEERDRIVTKLRSYGRFRDEPIRFRTKSGKLIIALWSAESVNLSGQQVMLSMITDITQLRHAEEERERLGKQLQQAQKMESVGRLAGGIAHDFNNMLGVILGYSELALKKTDPQSPLNADLRKIHQAGERSAELTRQLLAFARKQTIAPKVIDINGTVEGMLNMLRRLIGEDIDLLWHPGRKLQPVKIDPSQIDQLLVNLCVNARDAIEGVGKITIETSVKSFDEDYFLDHFGAQSGDYVLLEVSDNGCGMDKETLSHIFEPFFTTKEEGQGTGLGLASIYGIVKQNNGFIYVYSEPGQGTTFKIYLPLCSTKLFQSSEKAHDLPTERGNETILLVEDEPAILEMTTIMLESTGYTVIAASTPGDAIRSAHEYQGQFDLLMTDVVMPEMNGRQLVESLLSHSPDLKCLFMSGYTANVIAHHGVLDEGVNFIQKPFSMKNLGRKLREVLGD